MSLLTEPTVRKLDGVIRSQRYAHEAFELVLMGLRMAARKTYRPNLTRRGVGPAELCRAVLDLAVFRFDNRAGEVLAGWGIHRSEDV